MYEPLSLINFTMRVIDYRSSRISQRNEFIYCGEVTDVNVNSTKILENINIRYTFLCFYKKCEFFFEIT